MDYVPHQWNVLYVGVRVPLEKKISEIFQLSFKMSPIINLYQIPKYII